jgi:acyl carrier protein
VPEALGALTVVLADPPTTQPRRALPESSTESTFAEVLADSPATQPRRARSESITETTSAEVLADSPATQARSVRPESSTENAFAEVLADVMQVERVSVDSNFFDDLGADSMVMARFSARVRKRPDLPAVSIKDIYQHRTIRSLTTALADTTPMPVERVFADLLADVIGVERVSVDSNFLDDLGADSMVMARFCARVRKRPDLPSVSIKDIYQHPTIKSLAAAFTDASLFLWRHRLRPPSRWLRLLRPPLRCQNGRGHYRSLCAGRCGC